MENEYKEKQARLREYDIKNRADIRAKQKIYFKQYYEENKEKFKQKHKESYNYRRVRGANIRWNTYKNDPSLTVEF